MYLPVKVGATVYFAQPDALKVIALVKMCDSLSVYQCVDIL